MKTRAHYSAWIVGSPALLDTASDLTVASGRALASNNSEILETVTHAIMLELDEYTIRVTGGFND